MDSGDGNPQQELLNLNPAQIGDGLISKTTRNLLVVVHKIVELNVAGVIHLHLEISVFRQRISLDGGRKEPPGEAVSGKEVMEVLGGGDSEGDLQENRQRKEDDRDGSHGCCRLRKRGGN